MNTCSCSGPFRHWCASILLSLCHTCTSVTFLAMLNWCDTWTVGCVGAEWADILGWTGVTNFCPSGLVCLGAVFLAKLSKFWSFPRSFLTPELSPFLLNSYPWGHRVVPGHAYLIQKMGVSWMGNLVTVFNLMPHTLAGFVWPIFLPVFRGGQLYSRKRQQGKDMWPLLKP